MQISLLYGPGESAKREQLLKIKRQYPEDTINLDLKHHGLVEINDAIATRSLFDQGKRLVVVENANKGLDLKELRAGDDQTHLVVVAANLEAISSLLKSAQALKAAVLNFEAEKEQSVFPYLDYLIEKKPQALVELEGLLSGFGGIYILTMIYYGLRRNVLPPPTSPFMTKKIDQQRRFLAEGDIEKLYRLTLETEFKIKSGLVEERVGLTQLTAQILGR